MFLLSAIARGDWYEAVGRVRAAVEECGFVLEERPFSGIMVAFRIELRAARAGRFSDALRTHAVILDAASEAALVGAIAACTSDVLEGMLSVSFPDGDPDKSRPTPAVPG
jgi:hypothetical protein